MAQRRKRGELAAAKRAFWDHVPDWEHWASRPGLYRESAPWRSRIRFEGGLKTESEAR